MAIKCCTFSILLAAGICASLQAAPRLGKPAPQSNWGYVTSGPAEVYSRAKKEKSSLAKLPRGALVAVYKVEPHEAAQWAQVEFSNPKSGEEVKGWTDSSQLKLFPVEQFPADAKLLEALGGAYLEDFVASSTAISRYLVYNSSNIEAMVCFVTSMNVPQARLQVFLATQGNFLPGPSVQFPSDIGIEVEEIRDLIGDGNQCLITREPFNIGPQVTGTDLVIRQIDGAKLLTLWKAPVEYRNLSDFPSQLHILQPLEKNIGAGGTVTEGDVEFQPHNGAADLVWKGSIGFYVFGRKDPIQKVSLEKTCTWDGFGYLPLVGPRGQ